MVPESPSCPPRGPLAAPAGQATGSRSRIRSPPHSPAVTSGQTDIWVKEAVRPGVLLGP